MSKSKKLNKRQLAVLDDLFAGKLEEQAVLEKHHVSRSLFERWLADERLAEQFEQRIARAQRQSRVILARYAPTGRRQADGIDGLEEPGDRPQSLPRHPLAARRVRRTSRRPTSPPTLHQHRQSQALSAETASRLLAALAKGQQCTLRETCRHRLDDF